MSIFQKRLNSLPNFQNKHTFSLCSHKIKGIPLISMGAEVLKQIPSKLVWLIALVQQLHGISNATRTHLRTYIHTYIHAPTLEDYSDQLMGSPSRVSVFRKHCENMNPWYAVRGDGCGATTRRLACTAAGRARALEAASCPSNKNTQRGLCAAM